MKKLVELIGVAKYKDKTLKNHVKDGINNSLNNGKNFGELEKCNERNKSVFS